MIDVSSIDIKAIKKAVDSWEYTDVSDALRSKQTNAVITSVNSKIKHVQHNGFDDIYGESILISYDSNVSIYYCDEKATKHRSFTDEQVVLSVDFIRPFIRQEKISGVLK